MKTLFFVVISMIPGCWPCEPQIFEMGKIPQDVLDQLPYSDDESMALVHSAGKIIQFSIDQVTEDMEEIFCDECCDTYLYEEVSTSLQPDHPIFDCSMYLNSMDTSWYALYISIGRAYFQVPVSDHVMDYYDQADSLKIGSRYYQDVYRLVNESGYQDRNTPEGYISIDSLYFNFNEGILKITMTNDEYYTLVD